MVTIPVVDVGVTTAEPVGTIFENGTKVYDLYSNTEATVDDGKVSLNSDYTIILLEEKK